MIVTIDKYDAVRIYYYNARMKVLKDFKWDDELDFITSGWTQLKSMNDARDFAKRCAYEILHDDGED